MLPRMLARVQAYFKDSKLVRMSNGTYCVVRDLGPVKGGKGMRHHEVLVVFSRKGLWPSIKSVPLGLTRQQHALTKT
jgi:hypothetical protein